MQYRHKTLEAATVLLVGHKTLRGGGMEGWVREEEQKASVSM